MTELITSEEVWEGETVLYGVVERVGGKEPRVRIRLIEEETITVAVDIPTAKALGKRLYSEVGLKGIVKWDKYGRIVSFSLKEILPYEDKGILEAFNELKSLYKQ